MMKIMEKPYEQMDDLGGPPLFLETPISIYSPPLQKKKHSTTIAHFNFAFQVPGPTFRANM